MQLQRLKLQRVFLLGRHRSHSLPPLCVLLIPTPQPSVYPVKTVFLEMAMLVQLPRTVAV